MTRGVLWPILTPFPWPWCPLRWKNLLSLPPPDSGHSPHRANTLSRKALHSTALTHPPATSAHARRPSKQSRASCFSIHTRNSPTCSLWAWPSIPPLDSAFEIPPAFQGYFYTPNSSPNPPQLWSLKVDKIARAGLAHWSVD